MMKVLAPLPALLLIVDDHVVSVSALGPGSAESLVSFGGLTTARWLQ